MKKFNYLFALICCFSILTTYAQNNNQGWAWAKRGGSASGFNNYSPNLDRYHERILDIAVDSHNNYYFLAEVAGYDFTLDTLSFTTYNDDSGDRDIFVFSTDSAGHYRWSKTIGGGYYDLAVSLGVDSANNVYVSGVVSNVFGGTTPVHFDSDTTMEEASFQDSGPFNKGGFIIKYNAQGVYQWLLMPGDTNCPYVFENTTGNGNATLLKTVVAPNGTTRNLIQFRSGTHLNGQLTVGWGQRVEAVVNYDSNGNLLSFFTFNMHPYIQAGYKYQLAYDPNLDRYYIADMRRKFLHDTLGINTHTSTTDGFYVAALNNQGEVLWYHQNQAFSKWTNGDLHLDDEGNIYFTGIAVGDTFAGYDFSSGTGTGVNLPFLMKLDSNGNLIWGTNAQQYSPFPGESVVIRGGEVYLGLGITYDTWGNVTIPGIEGQGLIPNIAIMKFDAATGAPQAVIRDQNTPSVDAITAMALDKNGDLVVGGYFGSGLFYGTPFHLLNNGADSDFFIAKYNLPPDTTMGVQQPQKVAIKAYPNPTKGVLHLQSPNPIKHYTLYNLQGRILLQGRPKSHQINMATLQPGLYILTLTNTQGRVVHLKVVKE